MDKQKQIEEMAKVICTHINPCENCTEYDFGYCKFLGWCEKLYNAGYRKIPENAVVLTREEYKAHKKLAEAVYEGGAFDHYDNVIKSANILFKERKNLIEDTRKETAEKFAKEAKNIEIKLELTGNPYVCRYTAGDIEAVANGIRNAYIDKINKIAKEFTESKETPLKTGDIPKGEEIPDKNNIVENSGDYCAVCGGYVAEGRQVCPNCENMSKGANK